MAVTATTLRTHHPEWTDAPDGVISEMIARALRDVDVDLWGDDADDGVELRACWYLAQAPFAQEMRVEPPSGDLYDKQYREKQRVIGMAHRMGCD